MHFASKHDEPTANTLRTVNDDGWAILSWGADRHDSTEYAITSSDGEGGEVIIVISVTRADRGPIALTTEIWNYPETHAEPLFAQIATTILPATGADGDHPADGALPAGAVGRAIERAVLAAIEEWPESRISLKGIRSDDVGSYSTTRANIDLVEPLGLAAESDEDSAREDLHSNALSSKQQPPGEGLSSASVAPQLTPTGASHPGGRAQAQPISSSENTSRPKAASAGDIAENMGAARQLKGFHDEVLLRSMALLTAGLVSFFGFMIAASMIFNNTYPQDPFSEFRIWHVPISSADGIAAMVGLLALVATINIAQAVAPRFGEQGGDADVVGWGSTLSSLALWAALAGILLSLSLWFNGDLSESWGADATVSVLAALSTVLAASIRTWAKDPFVKSAESEENARTAAEIDRALHSRSVSSADREIITRIKRARAARSVTATPAIEESGMDTSRPKLWKVFASSFLRSWVQVTFAAACFVLLLFSGRPGFAVGAFLLMCVVSWAVTGIVGGITITLKSARMRGNKSDAVMPLLYTAMGALLWLLLVTTIVAAPTAPPLARALAVTWLFLIVAVPIYFGPGPVLNARLFSSLERQRDRLLKAE